MRASPVLGDCCRRDGSFLFTGAERREASWKNKKCLSRNGSRIRGVVCLKAEKALDVTVDFDIKREDLLQVIGNYDALIVRSVTKVNEELYDAAKKLKVIGRAGNGVDNIDLDGATKRGIIVVNTPEANIISAAEHTIGLLLASCRNTVRANKMLEEGIWERKDLKGSELYHKTLGIIGLGRIGALVTKRMHAF